MKKFVKIFSIVLICMSVTIGLVACDFKGSSIYDVASQSGLNNEQTSIQGTTSGSSQVQPIEENHYTINNNITEQKVDRIAEYEYLKENEGYDKSFAEFLKEFVYNSNTSSSAIEVSANKNLMSVVRICSVFDIKKQPLYSGFGYPALSSTTSKELCAGSGVIYDLDKENGNAYIITNYHVVYLSANSVDNDLNLVQCNSIASTIKCYLYGSTSSISQEYSNGNIVDYNFDDGYAIDCEYVGGSALYDIAILKVTNSNILKASNAIKAEIDLNTTPIVGKEVVAIGNPSGTGIAVTKGIVSVDSEYITMTSPNNAGVYQYRAIRIDAPINPGNSGGGLFDEDGKLIGIVNAKIVDDSIENIGYAIPALIADGVAKNIIANCDGQEKTSMLKATLGITLKSINTYAKWEEATLTTKVEEIVAIDKIDSGSLADGKLAENSIIKQVIINKVDDSSKTINISRLFQVVDSTLELVVGDKITFVMTDFDGNNIEDVTFEITQDCLTIR